MKKTTFTSPPDAILKNVQMFSVCVMHSGKAFLSLPSQLKFYVVSIKKYTVAPVATIAEIEIFLSQRCSSLPSLLSLNSVFPYIATVAETRFSTTVAIVATGAIIWKPC